MRRRHLPYGFIRAGRSEVGGLTPHMLVQPPRGSLLPANRQANLAQRKGGRWHRPKQTRDGLAQIGENPSGRSVWLCLRLSLCA